MIQHIIKFSFLLLMTNKSVAQMTQFDTLNSKMFYNVMINDPDSIVLDFCEKYFPSYTKSSNSGNLIKAPESESSSEIFNTEHGLVLTRHPLIQQKIKNAKLLLCGVEDKIHLPRINCFRLELNFETKEEVKTVMNHFQSLYDATSAKKIIQSEKDINIVKYQSVSDSWNWIKFFHTTENCIRVSFGCD